jgi:hypothetical protein
MQMAGTERTRLFVDSVGTTITADVSRRSADSMIVTQALPFLRLDTSVVGDDGRRARIARVGIAMDGDVPRLSIELLNEPFAESFVPAEHVSTEPTLDAPAYAPVVARRREDDTVQTFTPGVSVRPARTDGTVPYELQNEDTPSREIVLSDIPPPIASNAIELASPPQIEAPWHVRVWRGLYAFLSSFLDRAALALPPSSRHF